MLILIILKVLWINLQITQNIAFESLAFINSTGAWTAIPSVLQSV